jgi:hypothetical protein
MTMLAVVRDTLASRAMSSIVNRSNWDTLIS